MKIRDAADVLRSLLEGADPDTGEVLPEEHLLRHAEVREALMTALQVMETTASGAPPITRSGRLSAGRPWTQQDLEDLRSMYESGMSIDEIARLTHRRARGVRLQLNLMAGGGWQRNERVPIAETIDGEPPVAVPRSQHWTQADDASLAKLFHEGQDHNLPEPSAAVWSCSA